MKLMLTAFLKEKSTVLRDPLQQQIYNIYKVAVNLHRKDKKPLLNFNKVHVVD